MPKDLKPTTQGEGGELASPSQTWEEKAHQLEKEQYGASPSQRGKFTPGPWHAKRTKVYDAIYGPEDELVTFVGLRNNEEGIANAHLIAAAPELLEALKELEAIAGEATISLVNSHAVRKMGKFLAASEKARKAIAKAEGRSL